MQISQLFYYPVKSLGAIATTDLQITSWGPHRDRRMMLVDQSGKFVTQRQSNEMALFRTFDDGQILRFENDESVFELTWPALETSGQAEKTVQVWDDEVQATLVSQEASDWFSTQLKKDVNLVYMPESTERQVDLGYAQAGDKTGFSDGFPFLITTEASLEFLQKELPFDLSINRFRPNIVVSGSTPFAEDEWKRIVINGIEFDVVKRCSRCVIPSLNPETAERQPEVMKVLVKYRKQGNKVYFGQNMIHRGQGKIAVGDEVTVLS